MSNSVWDSEKKSLCEIDSMRGRGYKSEIEYVRVKCMRVRERSLWDVCVCKSESICLRERDNGKYLGPNDPEIFPFSHSKISFRWTFEIVNTSLTSYKGTQGRLKTRSHQAKLTANLHPSSYLALPPTTYNVIVLLFVKQIWTEPDAARGHSEGLFFILGIH